MRDAVVLSSSPTLRSPRHRPRLRALVLGWLLPAGFLTLQALLVFKEPIFTPVDELQHADYVRSVAEEARLPVFGATRTDPQLIALYLHVYPRRLTADQISHLSYPLQMSYEALQFPAFYLVAAPVYKLLDADPRVAIHGVRLLNVVFSVAELCVLIRLLQMMTPARPEAPSLIALSVMLIPGVTLRQSQVTNEVFAGLLTTVVFFLLARAAVPRPGGRAFVEGFTYAMATLAKATAVVVATPLAWAWATRAGGLRRYLAAGALGVMIPAAAWLAWSIPIYGNPLPFMGHRVTIFPSPQTNTLSLWLRLGGWLENGFFFPYEWDPQGTAWRWLLTVTEGVGTVILLTAGAVAVRSIARRPDSVAHRPIVMALLTFATFLVGYLVFEVSLQRMIYGTDPRELYVLLGPLAVLLAALALWLRRVPAAVLFGAMIATWLSIDVGLYVLGVCARCP